MHSLQRVKELMPAIVDSKVGNSRNDFANITSVESFQRPEFDNCQDLSRNF